MASPYQEEGPMLRSSRTAHPIEVSPSLQGVGFMDHHSTATPNSSNRTNTLLGYKNHNHNDDPAVKKDEKEYMFQEKLYDREEQHAKLWKAYRKRKNSKSAELYLITGPSGTGKTALATSLKGDVRRDGGLFCSGKFGHSGVGNSNKPYAPFVSMLRDLPQQLGSLNKGSLTELQHKVAAEIGPEMHILLDAAPDLVSVFPEELFTNIPATTTTTSAAKTTSTAALPESPFARRFSNDLQVRRVASEPPPPPSSYSRRVNSTSEIQTTRRLSNEIQTRRLSNNDYQTPRRLAGNRPASRRLSASSSTASSVTGYSIIHPLPQNTFPVVFKRFMRLLRFTKRPVLLLLDDVQWGDPNSLKLLEDLLKPATKEDEKAQQGIMVLGTCRANEVQLDHPLAQCLRRMEDSGVKIVETKMKNLTQSGLSQMIADIIQLPSEECTPLAEIVFKETRGNAFFAKQYIQSLHEDEKDGILTNLTAESHKNTTEELIVQLLSRQMKRFPTDVQYLLQVASCLGGGGFTSQVLCQAARQESVPVQDALTLFQERHIITFKEDTQCWIFAHDKYQEAAYSLIPVADQQRFHLKLGRDLLAHLAQDELPEYVVLIADLMAVGMDFLMDEDERENLALMCLEAGRRVALTCSLACAIDYMERGIRLLALRHWRDQYSLSLDLFNAAAELAYCNGKHDRVDVLVEEIRKNARCFVDQLQAYMTSILSLGARGEAAKAIAVGTECLTQLGHPLPKGRFSSQRDFNKVQRSLHSMTRQQILDLPIMDDAKVMAAMTIIQMLHPIFSATCPELTTMTGSLLVRLTLKYGLGPMSSIGFALYGLSLVRMGNLEEGYLYGQLSLQLLERESTRECSAKVFLTLAVGPIPSKKPYSQSIELLRQASNIGLETGDIETALRASMCYAFMRLYTGNPLWSVVKSVRDLTRLCNDYGCVFTSVYIQPYLSVCMHLVGCKKENFDLEFIRKIVAESTSDLHLLYSMYAYFYLAMYLNELDIAELLTVEIKKRKSVAQWMLPFSQTYHLFCQGLVAAGQSRTKRNKIRVARKNLGKLRVLGEHSADNIWNKVCLIEAELEACSGRTDSAILMYDKSIQIAEKQGFVNEQALACEKAGFVLLDAGRVSDADWYITRARNLYRRWGANTKVDEMVKFLNEDKHAKCYVASGSGGSLQTD